MISIGIIFLSILYMQKRVMMWVLTNPNNNNTNYSFNIDKFYKNYINGPKIFRKRESLDPSFIPDELPHRDAEIEQIAGLTAWYTAEQEVLPYRVEHDNTF